MIPKPPSGRSASLSTVPTLPHSASLPPTSFRAALSTSSQPVRTNRRCSDRIRSAYDSGSGSDDDPASKPGVSSSSRQAQSFPSSGIPVPVQYRPLPPRRVKTVSDPSRLESPLTMKYRNAGGPPSAFGEIGGFARPSPASRRRRDSLESTPAGARDVRSPEHPFARSTGFSSVGATTPHWNAGLQSQPISPISPRDTLDTTSFHARAKSPDEVKEEVRSVEGIPQLARERGLGERDADVDHDVIGYELSENSSIHPRLSRISVCSSIKDLELADTISTRPNQRHHYEHLTTNCRPCRSKTPSWTGS